MIALRFVFFAQLLVMLYGFTIFLVAPVDFHTLAMTYYLVIVGFCVLLFALWQFVSHPARRS